MSFCNFDLNLILIHFKQLVPLSGQEFETGFESIMSVTRAEGRVREFKSSLQVPFSSGYFTGNIRWITFFSNLFLPCEQVILQLCKFSFTFISNWLFTCLGAWSSWSVELNRGLGFCPTFGSTEYFLHLPPKYNVYFPSTFLPETNQSRVKKESEWPSVYSNSMDPETQTWRSTYLEFDKLDNWVTVKKESSSFLCRFFNMFNTKPT